MESKSSLHDLFYPNHYIVFYRMDMMILVQFQPVMTYMLALIQGQLMKIRLLYFNCFSQANGYRSSKLTV